MKMNLINNLIINEKQFLTTISILYLLNSCYCEIEPKPNYEDVTISITKQESIHSDLSSINNNNNNNNNNYINNNLSNNNNEKGVNGNSGVIDGVRGIGDGMAMAADGHGNDDDGGGGGGVGGPNGNNLNVINDSTTTIGDVSFLHAFIASLSVILVSELGDKTFFIAAIMAMRHSRFTVFGGAISALALMTILSAVFGMAATIIPRVYTYYISTALFAIFGLKMLKEGYYMSATDAQEELEEVQSDLRKREDELEKEVSSTLVIQDPESGGVVRKSKQTPSAFYLASRIFMQAFTMTFLAEWGDRSQLTTIILAAREDVYGIIVGGVLGHALCTGLAVIGGRMIAQKISVRTVTIVGGVVFLLFAISALFFNPNDE